VFFLVFEFNENDCKTQDTHTQVKFRREIQTCRRVSISTKKKNDIIHQHITLRKRPEIIFQDFFRGENAKISLPWLIRICNHITKLTPEELKGWVMHASDRAKVCGKKRKLERHEINFFLDMTTDHRCMKLSKLVEKFFAEYYEDNHDVISTDTAARILKRERWSRHAVERRNILKDPSVQLAYLENISFVNANRIVDIDGTIQNPKDFQMKMGWAPEGEPAMINQIVINSRTFAIHAAYTEKGFIAWQIFEGVVTDTEVCAFLINTLQPMLFHDSFGIIDNASNQRTDRAKEVLNDTFQGMFLYCAPYSPELKPVERGFANVKRFIREHESEGAVDPVALIERAFSFYSVAGESSCSGMFIIFNILFKFIFLHIFVLCIM
jgi:hypothetical protein